MLRVPNDCSEELSEKLSERYNLLGPHATDFSQERLHVVYKCIDSDRHLPAATSFVPAAQNRPMKIRYEWLQLPLRRNRRTVMRQPKNVLRHKPVSHNWLDVSNLSKIVTRKQNMRCSPRFCCNLQNWVKNSAKIHHTTRVRKTWFWHNYVSRRSPDILLGNWQSCACYQLNPTLYLSGKSSGSFCLSTNWTWAVESVQFKNFTGFFKQDDGVF